MSDSAVVDGVQAELTFVERYRDRLKTRRKHGTIREGRRIPGALTLPVRVSPSGDFMGNVLIEEVRWLRFSEINSPEILRYEFPSNIESLTSDLQAIYPTLKPDSWVTFFRFRFVDEAPR